MAGLGATSVEKRGMANGQPLDELSLWELPAGLEERRSAVSYDGQVYFRCRDCGSEIRSAPMFAATSSEIEWRCRRCGDTRHELVVHSASCSCECEECREKFGARTSGLDEFKCPRCSSGRVTIDAAVIEPAFAASCEEGHGWREAFAAPEVLEEVLNRPRHVWGLSAGDDVDELMQELQLLAPMPEFSSHLRWAARFCRRLRLFGDYPGVESATQIMNLEGAVLHDYFRSTRDVSVGIESLVLCEEALALEVEPFNVALQEHNFAMRVYSLLREFGDRKLGLIYRPGLRGEAVAAAEHALDFFTEGAGRDAEGAPRQAALIRWCLGDLLSITTGVEAASALEDLRSLFPLLDQALHDVQDAGAWAVVSEQPTDDDLHRAVDYLSEALDSALLRDDWALAARQSRAAGILNMSKIPPDLRAQAIADLESVVAVLDVAEQPQAWIALRNLSSLYLMDGDPGRALPLLERACSRAIVGGRRTYDESTLHAHSEQFVSLFDMLAHTYVALDRPLDALCAVEVLRGATIRFHTMAEVERTAVAESAQNQRQLDALTAILARLGGEPGALEGPPFDEVLGEIGDRIREGASRWLTETHTGVVSFVLQSDTVLALVARATADGELDVQAASWAADVDHLVTSILLTPLEPSSWRERRLQTIDGWARRCLWEPLSDTLKDLGVSDVVVSPPGLLSLVPFEAMVENGSEGRGDAPTVTYLPSLRLGADLHASVSRFRGREAGRVLAIKYRGHDLPQVTEELEMLRKLYGDDLSILDCGEAAKHDVLEALAGDWDLVHFACHGSFDRGDPWNSALHLVPDPLRDSQRLSARDLLGVRFTRSPIVVLSACSTALNSSSTVNDAAGLTGGFLRAGAGGIVAARWPVYDDTALTFMADFHALVRARTSPPIAVRDTQQRLRVDHGLEDWAAFGYIGIP